MQQAQMQQAQMQQAQMQQAQMQQVGLQFAGTRPQPQMPQVGLQFAGTRPQPQLQPVGLQFAGMPMPQPQQLSQAGQFSVQFSAPQLSSPPLQGMRHQSSNDGIAPPLTTQERQEQQHEQQQQQQYEQQQLAQTLDEQQPQQQQPQPTQPSNQRLLKPLQLPNLFGSVRDAPDYQLTSSPPETSVPRPPFAPGGQPQQLQPPQLQPPQLQPLQPPQLQPAQLQPQLPTAARGQLQAPFQAPGLHSQRAGPRLLPTQGSLLPRKLMVRCVVSDDFEPDFTLKSGESAEENGDRCVLSCEESNVDVTLLDAVTNEVGESINVLLDAFTNKVESNVDVAGCGHARGRGSSELRRIQRGRCSCWTRSRTR